MRCATATNHSAITAGRPPGCSRAENALADDGAIGSAERAARRAPGMGHRKRTDPSHSRFRHQGTYATSRADPDGQRRRPGPIRGRLPTVRPAAGPPATPGRRHQPAAAVMGRHVDDIGDHQRRNRCPHPRRHCGPRCSRTGLPSCAKAYGCDRTISKIAAAARSAVDGCACCTGTTTAPPNWPPDCGICRAGPAPAGDCSTTWPPPPTFRVDSSRPQLWCAICSPIPVLPDELVPYRWPGTALRQAYAQLRRRAGARGRRTMTELMEADE